MVRASVVVLATATVVALLAPAAHAEPTKRECIDANTQAQVALKGGRLRAAKVALQSCAVAACPASVAQDCTQRLDAVALRVPSIIVAAKDATGHALTAVRVRLDDKPLTEKLDETAFDVEPGEHKLTFEVDGEPPVTSTIMIQERDVGHRLEVVIGGKASSGSSVAMSPETGAVEAPPKAAPGGTRRVAAFALGGVGVAGLVVGGVLGGLAASKWSKSKDACADAKTCADHDTAVADHTSAEHLATGSTVAILTGGVLAVTGLVIYLMAPRQRSVGISPTTNGAVLVGSF